MFTRLWSCDIAVVEFCFLGGRVVMKAQPEFKDVETETFFCCCSEMELDECRHLEINAASHLICYGGTAQRLATS